MAHHGETLDAIIKRTTFTKDEIATKLGVNRRTIYHWIEREELTEEIIDRVGRAIDVDMRQAAPSVFGDMAKFKITKRPMPPINTADEWKDKYISTLEQLNHLKDLYQAALREIADLRARPSAA